MTSNPVLFLHQKANATAHDIDCTVTNIREENFRKSLEPRKALMSFNVSSRSGTQEEQSIEEDVDTVTVKKVGVA